jgi:hypothetical protein
MHHNWGLSDIDEKGQVSPVKMAGQFNSNEDLHPTNPPALYGGLMSITK